MLIPDGLSVCGGNAFAYQVVVASGKGQEGAVRIYRSKINIVEARCPARKLPTEVCILDVRKRRHKVNRADHVSHTGDGHLVSRRTCVTLIETIGELSSVLPTSPGAATTEV